MTPSTRSPYLAETTNLLYSGWIWRCFLQRKDGRKMCYPSSLHASPQLQCSGYVVPMLRLAQRYGLRFNNSKETNLQLLVRLFNRTRPSGLEFLNCEHSYISSQSNIPWVFLHYQNPAASKHKFLFYSKPREPKSLSPSSSTLGR